MTITQQSPIGPPGDHDVRSAAVTTRRPRLPPWVRDAAGALTWASVLVVTALWVAGGGVTDLAGAGAVASVGRLSGLVSADLLLIQVLLMARIPMVERVYGQDELTRRHRLVGFTSFCLMLVHVAAVGINLGWRVRDGRQPIVKFWTLIVDQPGMLLALAGTMALILVTITSIRRARRRLRYESWHLLHLYAYVGVGLALPHQLWAGQDFLANTPSTIYWWSAWIAAAGATVFWRIGVPIVRTLRHDLRVASVVRESPEIVSIWMTGRDLHRLPVVAGQFFIWRFLSGRGWMRAHPYSLSAAPNGRNLRITVKDLGDGSRALAGLRPGTRVIIEGPYGRLHEGVRSRRKVTLLASGIGITPLRALLEQLPQQPGDVTLIYRATDEHNLVLRNELDALAAARNAPVHYLLGPRIHDRQSWLPADAAQHSDVDVLRELVPDIAEHDVYVCGAQPWMDAARRAAIAAGVPTARVHRERFGW
jgi:predicted ferric reductase